jgi:hypothetical protein
MFAMKVTETETDGSDAAYARKAPERVRKWCRCLRLRISQAQDMKTAWRRYHQLQSGIGKTFCCELRCPRQSEHPLCDPKGATQFSERAECHVCMLYAQNLQDTAVQIPNDPIRFTTIYIIENRTLFHFRLTRIEFNCNG